MKLEVLNIKKYNQRKVVNDVSFEINKGEIIGLLGPNGAGKTTSFYILVGLVNPNKGKVLLDGEDISKNPMYGSKKRHKLFSSRAINFQKNVSGR